MSTPVLDRPKPARQRVAQRPARRASAPGVPTQRQASRQTARQPNRQSTRQPGRSTAAQRAYTRREDRWRRVHEPATRRLAAATSGRAAFVLLIMGLFGAGLIATLWLSTAATADSYRLGDAHRQAQELSEHSARLRDEVAAAQSPPSLAQAATDLGMVPAREVARLVVGPDGTVTVVGSPRAAVAPAPAPASAPPVAPAAPGQPAPAEPAPAATPPAAAQPVTPPAAGGR